MPSKYAIVTPYYQESELVLRRCLTSVRNQDVNADHIFVADGSPQGWLDGETVRHIKLDKNHADFGNTPRGIGGLLAICGGYEGIGFLDADNWLEPSHISSCVRQASSVTACDFVIAKRHMRRPDGSKIDMSDEAFTEHVDTNCFFFLAGSFHVIPHFAMMPKELAGYCDRIFYSAIRRAGLRSAVMAAETVNYECLWETIYSMIGETPPAGAKPNIDLGFIDRWLQRLTPRELEIAGRLSGTPLLASAPSVIATRKPARNDLCPCGSGQKYKKCHGR